VIRGKLLWFFVTCGIGLVLILAAVIGDRNDEGEQVSAGRWAQSVCGAVGVWRGTMEAIVESIRTPPAVGGTTTEPQSETPQARTVLVRGGLERAVEATETMVEAVDRSGTPDTPEGEEAERMLTRWADDSLEELRDAEDSLDEEADTIEEAVEQFAEAAGAIASTLSSGIETLGEIAELDPELADALRRSSTCQRLREGTEGQ
jgi:hypothetical protein